MLRTVLRRLVATVTVGVVVLVVGQPALGLGGESRASRAAGGWVVLPSPNEGPLTDVATAVSFVSPTDGWLVGGFLQPIGDGTAFRTLVERWNGRQWSLVESPDPGLDNLLTGVVARGQNDAWAVGWSTQIDEFGGSVSVPLIVHWDGVAWTVVPSPDIGAASGTLSAVAATESGELWAVGSRTVAVGSPERTLAMRYANGAWTAVATQDVRGRYSRLTGVAAGGSDVWAVGLSVDPTGTAPNATLVEALGPSGGRIVQSPNPWKDGNELYGVAASGSSVWAVGDGLQDGNLLPLVLRYVDRSWRAVACPIDEGSGTLLGVGPARDGQFWAVGFTLTPEFVHRPLIARWSAGRWIEQPSPSPSPGGDMLAAVAAASATQWMAVGNGIGSAGFQRTLVMARGLQV